MSLNATTSITACEMAGMIPAPRTHKDRLAALKALESAQQERAAIAERKGVQGRRGRPTSNVLRVALTTVLAPLAKGEPVTLRADSPIFDGLTLVKNGAFAGTAAVRAACLPILIEMGFDTSRKLFARTDAGKGTDATYGVTIDPNA